VLFRSFGHRGEADIFIKHSNNPDSGFYSYGCFYIKKMDSIKLTISRFENFKKDFPCDMLIDASKFNRVVFNKLRNASVRISIVNNRGQDQIIVESIPLKTLFPINDPFEKFKYLSDLKDSLGILGTFYRPDIGNFIQFYLSSQYILTYLPDNAKINPKFKDVWLNEFATGKTIKRNWNYRKLDKPRDNE
jgi:hypothetical protein